CLAWAMLGTGCMGWRSRTRPSSHATTRVSLCGISALMLLAFGKYYGDAEGVDPPCRPPDRSHDKYVRTVEPGPESRVCPRFCAKRDPACRTGSANAQKCSRGKQQWAQQQEEQRIFYPAAHCSGPGD